MQTFIKKNLVSIIFIVLIIVDTIFKYSSELGLAPTQIAWLKVIGVILSVVLKKAPELVVDAIQRKINN